MHSLGPAQRAFTWPTSCSQWDVSQLSALAMSLISPHLRPAESGQPRLAIFPLIFISIFEIVYTAPVSNLYVCSEQDDAPTFQRSPYRNCQNLYMCRLPWQSDFADITKVKDLELRRVFWIIWVAQCDHKGPSEGTTFPAAKNQRETRRKKDVMPHCWFLGHGAGYVQGPRDV